MLQSRSTLPAEAVSFLPTGSDLKYPNFADSVVSEVCSCYGDVGKAVDGIEYGDKCGNCGGKQFRTCVLKRDGDSRPLLGRHQSVPGRRAASVLLPFFSET